MSELQTSILKQSRFASSATKPSRNALPHLLPTPPSSRLKPPPNNKSFYTASQMSTLCDGQQEVELLLTTDAPPLRRESTLTYQPAISWKRSLDFSVFSLESMFTDDSSFSDCSTCAERRQVLDEVEKWREVHSSSSSQDARDVWDSLVDEYDQDEDDDDSMYDEEINCDVEEVERATEERVSQPPPQPKSRAALAPSEPSAPQETIEVKHESSTSSNVIIDDKTSSKKSKRKLLRFFLPKSTEEQGEATATAIVRKNEVIQVHCQDKGVEVRLAPPTSSPKRKKSPKRFIRRSSKQEI